MSINPETDLNLEELFQPAWAKEADSKKQYAKFEPRDRPDRGDRRGRPQGGGFNRPRGDQRGERRQGGGPDRRRGPRRDFRDQGRAGRPERRDPPPPPPEVNVALHAEDQGAESLARQIKTTGRAYPLFDIARMILQKPDRFNATFSSKKGEDGKPLQPLFVCALDDSAWLSEDEAVAHVLRNHLATFYQADRTEIEAPKGTYTFVAQCGMSGVIFGPPNHHDYQTKLHELHAKRFARMPFETYKSRVRIVRDEAVVKQWVDEQSWKTEYVCLNVPDAARLPDMAAVEKNFREVHQPAIIREVDSHTVPGPACQKLRGGLYRIYRDQMDQQRRFPMQVATSLSQQFASRGLQFFKVNKSVTHVWVARPHFLDLENEPVSDNIRRIVEFINGHPKCTRRQLVETLAPAPVPATTPSTPEPAPTEGTEAKEEKSTAPPPQETAPTPEQSALIGDLHWLIHQGHVIEFADGRMETAKKPAPKPQPTPKKKKIKPEQAKPEPEKKEPEASAPPQTPAPAAEASVAEAREPAPTPAEGTPDLQTPAETSPAEPKSAPAPAEPADPKPTAAAPVEPGPEKKPSAPAEAPGPEVAPAAPEPDDGVPRKDPPATPPAQT